MLLSLASVDVADAAGKRTVTFAAPAAGALVRTDTVSVRVKAGPGISGVQVFAGPKDVSKRFTKHGRTFTAKLPRTLLERGANRLVVRQGLRRQAPARRRS